MRYLLLYILFSFFVFVTSCSSYSTSMDEYYEGWIYDFYNSNLRYPKSSTDFCRRFYACDSLNNFEYINGCPLDTILTEINSYYEYNRLLDSIHSFPTMIDGETKSRYKTCDWQTFYNNMSNDDIKIKKGKIIFYDRVNKQKYIVKELLPLVHKWCYIDYDEVPLDLSINQEYNIERFVHPKMCTKDSIVIDLPDTILKPYSTYSALYKMVDSATKPIQERLSNNDYIYYIVRYYRNGNIKSAEQERELPDEIINCSPLIHYMDSCVHIDDRIDFMQFYYGKRINHIFRRI